MTLAIVCSAVLAAAVFLLGLNVSVNRGRAAARGSSQLPTDPADPLLIAIRAHGNATEYVPTLIALFLLCAWLAPSPWTVALILGATLARLLHAFAMVTADTLAKESRSRVGGAIGTYGFGTALAVTAGVAALV